MVLRRSMLASRQAPGGAVLIDDLVEHPGSIFFVDSTSSSSGTTSGFGSGPNNPLSTIDSAVAQCTHDKGDVIYVMPGHTENKTDTGALITCDVRGVRFIGLGHDDIRPTLTFNHTGADITVTADDVWFDNFKFVCSVGDQTHVFDIQAKGFRLTNFKVRDDGANDNFIDFVSATSTVDNTADGLTLIDGDVVSDDTGNDGLVGVTADLDGLTIKGCKVYLGIAAESIINVATTKDLTNMYVGRNSFYRLVTAPSGGLLADPDTTDQNTGLIEFNSFGHNDTQTEVWAPVTCEFRYIENYATALIDVSGYLLPAKDS